MPSKFSTGLCGVETCRRNFRQDLSGSKRAVEIFDKTFQGRNAPSKFSTRFCEVAMRRRNFRQDFGFSPSPFGDSPMFSPAFQCRDSRPKGLPCTGFKPGAGGMGAIPIPAINRRAMHGVETPTRRADSNPAMNCRAKHILIPPIPAFQRRDENPHPTGDLSPCITRCFNAGMGI